MNAPKKYVFSRTLKKPLWRDTTIIRDNVIESVRALKAEQGGNIPGPSPLVGSAGAPFTLPLQELFRAIE